MGRGTYYVRNPSKLSPPMFRTASIIIWGLVRLGKRLYAASSMLESFLVSGRVYVKDVCYIMGGLNARPNGASPTSVTAIEVTQ